MTQTILITGASGFIGAHLLHEFLGAGYHVRAAVRNDQSADKVRSTHGTYGDTLSFATVPDLTAAGAFDDAVKGVDGVVHAASPFTLQATDFDQELFQPARHGTENVLKAVKAHNPDVTRVVITSSFAAIQDYAQGERPGYTYSETDWNPMTAEEAITGGDPTAAYLVSKALAERAAFDFVEKEKPNFSIATIAPPMVYGPIAHAVSSMDSLNTSSADIYRLFNGTENEVPPTGFYAFADVRDVATAHLRAFERPAAANQRYLVANGPYTYQLLCDTIRAQFPDLRDGTPQGTPDQPMPDVYRLDTSKATKDLGIEFRSMEQMLVDSVRSLRAQQQILS